MATIHGIFAQVVFGLLVALAVLTARKPVAAVPRPLARCAVALAALLFAQVALGALVRHGPTPLTQRLHYLTAFIATAAAVWTLVAVLAERAARSRVRLAAYLLGGLLATQLVLGVEAWMAKFGSYTLPDLVPVTGWNAAIRTAHALVGTLLLASAVGIALRLRQPLASQPPMPDVGETFRPERTRPASRSAVTAGIRENAK